MEYHSLISMWETLFYTGNTTSTFITVVFSISCSWKFALSHIRCVAIPNCKLHTTPKQKASFWNCRKHHVCSDPYIYAYTTVLYFFQWSLCEVFKTFSWSFKYCCKIRCLTKYPVIVRTQVTQWSRFSTTSSMSHDTSGLHGMCLSANIKRYVVIFSVVWCKTWILHKTCILCFLRSLLRKSLAFQLIWTMKKLSTNADNCTEKVQTQTGRGSTPRANKEEGQRAVQTAPQSTHNGGAAGGGNKPLSFISLSHNSKQSESTAKFYNSSKADTEGNMLTLTSCLLRSDSNESVWMPTDLVKFLICPIHLLWKKFWHLVVIIIFIFFFIRGEPGPWRVGWGGGATCTCYPSMWDLPMCACVWGGLQGLVCMCVHVGNFASARVFVFPCTSVSLCFVWLSSNVLLCNRFLCASLYAFDAFV